MNLKEQKNKFDFLIQCTRPPILKAGVRRAVLFFLFILPVALVAAASLQEDEIVIEMHGEPSVLEQTSTLWDKSTAQLTRKLRGKTREQVLYAIPIVSDKDRIVRGKTAEYALVEYNNDGQFCKFLFQAENPQKFIAAATTPQEVFELNEKYGLQLGLSQKIFRNTYTGQYVEEAADILPDNIRVYHMTQTGKTPQNQWLVFENMTLTHTFHTEEEIQAYLLPFRKAAQENEKKQSPAPVVDPAKPQTVHEGLLYGGTLYDQMYMPRVIHSSFLDNSTQKNPSNP